MVSRKRGRQEMEADEPPKDPPLLDRIRNMWEFANLMQYLFTFGKAVKIDDELGIEAWDLTLFLFEYKIDRKVHVQDLETECLKPGHSERLSEIGLALLKFVSSHRGLTPDMLNEYTRRQYQSKLPHRNPFGDEETPKNFADFDIFTKIRVLYQLSQWTMIHSERIRERMPEQKDTDQSFWRIEPVGWDAHERSYLVLDDNRLYRCTDPVPPPPPPPKPKKNSKKAKAAARASKRRKLSEAAMERDGNETEDNETAVEKGAGEEDGFGGRKWECLAITLEQYRQFMEGICRTKNPNEKVLHEQLADNVLPIVEKAEEEQQRKIVRRQKELLNLEKLATAKRSSRIAGKLEKQKEEEDAIEAEKKRQSELAWSRKEQERLKKMEDEREVRILTREQRVKEREMRQILHEEELANLSEDSKKLQAGEGRMSERQLKAEVEKRKKALEELGQEQDWIFDCSGCGVHGENLDDGSGIISCESCNVWQHLACLGLSNESAEQKDFHFICNLCKRREEDKKKSVKNPIRLDFRKLGSSASPTSEKSPQVNGDALHSRKRRSNEAYSTSPTPKKPKHDQQDRSLDSHNHPSSNPKAFSAGVRDLSPSGQSLGSTRPNGAGASSSSISHTLAVDEGRVDNSILPNGRSPLSPPKKNGGGISNGPTSGNTTESQSTPSDTPARNNSSSSPQNGLGAFFNSFDRQHPNAHINNHVSPTKSKQQRLSMSPTLQQPNKESSSPRIGFPRSGGSPNSVLAPPPESASHQSFDAISLVQTSPSTQRPGRSPTTPAGGVFDSPILHAHVAASSPTTSSYPTTISTSNLPDAHSGLSPTKHQQSPPRPSDSSPTANGAMHEAHPTLPPAPSLSPPARHVDLTPPRKALTPEQALKGSGRSDLWLGSS
ncbi:MAG: hypothetical protein M1837_003969 [Sclerophora amabilis]|nr:MAG: hypothetical protein M1837_003969 [Sclerophora amabilis]